MMLLDITLIMVFHVITQSVKKYVKRLYGASSSEYSKVSSIKFFRLYA